MKACETHLLRMVIVEKTGDVLQRCVQVRVPSARPVLQYVRYAANEGRHKPSSPIPLVSRSDCGRQGSHTCRVWEAHFAQLGANGREKKTFSLGQSRTWTR